MLRFLLDTALANSVQGIVAILERFDDEKSILEAFDASTAYQLGGLNALVQWSCGRMGS